MHSVLYVLPKLGSQFELKLCSNSELTLKLNFNSKWAKLDQYCDNIGKIEQEVKWVKQIIFDPTTFIVLFKYVHINIPNKAAMISYKIKFLMFPLRGYNFEHVQKVKYGR